MFPNDFICHPLDDSAPYSVLETSELTIIQSVRPSVLESKLDPLHEPIANPPRWQYGTGSHASGSLQIKGSILLSLKPGNGHLVNTCLPIIVQTSLMVGKLYITRSLDIQRV